MNAQAAARLAGTACLLLFAGGAAIPADVFSSSAITVRIAPVTLAPGGRVESKITLEIAPGYRIVAHGATGRFLEPALLSFDAADGVFAEPPEWPAGAPWRPDEADPEVMVYEEGRLELKMIVRANPQAPARKEAPLQGRLRYQAIRGGFFRKVEVMRLSIPVTIGAAQDAPAKEKPATRP